MYILMSPRFLFGNVSQYLSELFHLKQFLRIVRTAPIENPEPVASPLFNHSYSTSIFVIKIQFGVSTFIGFPFITINFFS